MVAYLCFIAMATVFLWRGSCIFGFLFWNHMFTNRHSFMMVDFNLIACSSVLWILSHVTYMSPSGLKDRLGDCCSQIIFNCQSFGNCPQLKKAFLFKIIFSYQAQPEPSSWLIQGFKSQLNSEYPCQSLKEIRQSPSSPSANTWLVPFPSGVNYNSTAHWTSYRKKISLVSASWVTWPRTVLSSKADGLNHLLVSPQQVSKFLVVDGT